MTHDDLFGRIGTWVRVLAGLFAMVVSVRGAEPIHLKLPEDTLAFAELDPGTAGKDSNGTGNLVDLGLGVMRTTGMLTGEAKEVADILAMASEAGRRHSCLALLDAELGVSAEKDLECRSVQLAWVVDTGGQSGEMIEKLTGVLGHFSKRATAKETVRKTAEGKKEYVEFRDTTWPTWLCLDWAQVGDHFVLTVGDGAMAHYLADRAVGGVPWAGSVREMDKEAAGVGTEGSVISRVYVSVKGFRERFPAAMKETVLGRLFTGLDLMGSDAGVFSARSQGRAIAMDDGTVDATGVHVRPWTVKLGVGSPLLTLVPAEATGYVVLRVEWEVLWARVMTLLDAVVGEAGDEALRKVAEKFAAERGVDIQKDILGNLEPMVLVHDAPRHPLRLPLMVTVEGAAKVGTEAGVKRALGVLADAGSAALDKKGRGSGRLRLRKAADGVSYLQYGIVGQAWGWVANGWVFSWSPGAVRWLEGRGVVGGGAKFSER